jgi:hypothetical protein
MALSGAIGYAQSLDAREAGLQAANRALNQLGESSATFAIVIYSYRYDFQLILNGIASLLGNTPVIGFSTTAGLTDGKQLTQSVIVALLSSEDIKAEAHWFPAFAQSGEDVATRMLQLLGYQRQPAESILAFGDGFNGDAEQLCASIPGKFPLTGGLSCGDMHASMAYQFAGGQGGSGGLAAAFLRGKIKVGVGAAHGWQPVGPRARITRARGFWLRMLDNHPSSETYARLFGYSTREWANAPLNQMARLYPLGLDQGRGSDDLNIRSPLRVEADGSFRMNVQMREGTDAYVMVGDPTACKVAAANAATQALDSLGSARPVLALVMVDTAWQILLQAEPAAELLAVQKVLGPNMPIAGGYTLGQIIPGVKNQSPSYLNQHISVIIFAEPVEG